MSPFAPQTREIDFLMRFFKKLRLAKASGSYTLVEKLIDPQAILRTMTGSSKGSKAVLEHLRLMEEQPYHMEIVAPKGGLMTVLVSPIMHGERLPGLGYEQVYRILNDNLLEVIDLGRTPGQVFRPESQPS